MFAATAPEVDVEEDNASDECMKPQKDAWGQPSASSTATGSASSGLDAGKAASAAAEAASFQLYDVILMDYIHEKMPGDSKKLSKLAAEMWKSINNEDNALSLN